MTCPDCGHKLTTNGHCPDPACTYRRMARAGLAEARAALRSDDCDRADRLDWPEVQACFDAEAEHGRLFEADRCGDHWHAR